MELLFRPGKIGNMRLKNRMVMTPLHMGYTMRQEIAFLEARAKGGAASVTIVLGIDASGSPFPMHYIGEEIIPELRELAQRAARYDCRSIVQLFHCGRNCKEGKLREQGALPVAPSAVPSPIYKTVPRALETGEIHGIVRRFGQAAQICQDAGIDAVEISCSAGYLLNQFLSPHTNLREDEYGGSLENRMRFPMEVACSVRQAVGSGYPVLIRLSGAAMVDGGYSLEDMRQFAAGVKEEIDAFSVTGGWHESKIPQISKEREPGSLAHFAKAIGEATGKPAIACNRINTGELGEELLRQGNGDFIGYARAFIVDAEFANKVRQGIPYKKCVACNKCVRDVLKGGSVACPQNPGAGREWETGSGI